MTACRPAAHDDARGVAAAIRRVLRDPVYGRAHLCNNAVERNLRRQRIAGQRDVDTVRKRSRSEKAERFLCAHLPVTAVDENKYWPRFARGKVIDAIAFSRAIAQVEVLWLGRTQLRTARIKIRQQRRAIRHCRRVVVSRIERCAIHATIKCQRMLTAVPLVPRGTRASRRTPKCPARPPPRTIRTKIP